jgi:hypothetical protein
MKRPVLIMFMLISAIPLTSATEQIHDILIIGKDTIKLKSFPLEKLGFQVRPFDYYDFPASNCWRGYQATWKVIDHKLFLVEVARIDEPDQKLDLINYFKANDYEPVVIDGFVFADWFSLELSSYPKNCRHWGCSFFKTYKPKRDRPSIRFENGVLVRNRYKGPGK